MSRWYDLFAGSEEKFTDAGLQRLGVRPGERVLEVGFGTGHSLVKLAQEIEPSGLVIGVELSPGMIEVARKRLQIAGPERCVRIVCGDGACLPFAAHSFDAIFLSFTLELFSEAEIPVVLQECQRVMKPAGRLGVVSLAKRDTLACRLYEWGHERWPILLDCRPIYVTESLEVGGFRIQAAKVERMWGLPMEIVLGRLI